MSENELGAFLGRMQSMWSGPSLPYPGRSRDAAYATYVHYRREQPLPVPAAGDFGWLSAAGEPPTFEDLPVTTWGAGLTLESLRDRLGGAVPADLLAFAGSGLAALVPTVTDCYVDPARPVVDVPGGRLLHVLADSQGVLHWYLLVGDDGTTAVVVTDQPDLDRLDPDGPPQLGVVADSFTEFVWRSWLDNTIWLKVEDDLDLTADEQRYVDALAPLF